MTEETTTVPEPGVHYAYLGLALLLYGSLAGWCYYHVGRLVSVLELHSRPIPGISWPLFKVVQSLGLVIFAPLALLVVAELAFPRRPAMTRLYLIATILLVLGGIYAGIALYLPAASLDRP